MKKVIISVLLAGAVAGGVYVFMQSQNSTGTSNTGTSSNQTATTDPAAADKAKGVINTIFGPAAGMLKYKSATAGTNGSATLKNVEFTIPGNKSPVKIDEFAIEKFDTKNKPPLFSKFKIKGIHLDQKSVPNPQMALMLVSLGMSELVIDLDVDTSTDQSAKTSGGYIELKIRDIGKIKLDMALSDVNIEAMKQMQADPAKAANPMMALSLFKVKAFKVKYTNLGLKAKLKPNLPPEQISKAKEALKAQVAAAAHPIQKQVLQAAIDFLDKQNGFEMSIAPSEPMALMSLQAIPADQIISKLNFKVMAN